MLWMNAQVPHATYGLFFCWSFIWLTFSFIIWACSQEFSWMKSTPANHPSLVLILCLVQSNHHWCSIFHMITALFCFLWEFACKKNRFVLVISQHLISHKVCSIFLPPLHSTFVNSLFFSATFILPDLPWTGLSIPMMSHIPILLFMIWHDMPQSSIKDFL